MKRAVLRYLVENFDDLLELDLKIARIMGAPAPHTISSYAYLKWPRLRKLIDFLFRWLLNQDNHCKQDYDRVMAGKPIILDPEIAKKAK